MGEDCILFLMFCLSRARLSCLLFFPGCQTKREERWRGRHPGGREEGGWWGGGRWRGCWHALVSNLFESIAQFICFVSTATAEDNQTRRPLDTSYCPLMHPLPYPLSPPTPFFMWHADWRRSKGNSQASPNGGNVRKGTHIKTRLSWRYSMVQNLQSSTQDTHTHTFMLLCTPW